MDAVLFYLHYGLLLAFGLLLSAAFSGIRFSWRNVSILSGLFLFCGLLELFAYTVMGEYLVWIFYPVITHFPVILLLCLCYRKRFSTAFVAVTSAYLCCQPVNWAGTLLESLGAAGSTVMITQICTMVFIAFMVLRYLADSISEIYNKDTLSVLIFGLIPIVYYLFDYSMSVYTDLWPTNEQAVREFLPFFLCVVHVIFCAVYYEAYEKKADAERNEQIIRIALEQQSREIANVKRTEYEIRLLRHDMRQLLNTLQLCIDKDDKETARKMISGYCANVEATALHRYCANDTINYVLSAYASRCQSEHTEFIATVELTGDIPDEIMFSSILSNALDNALNAQKELPRNKRKIRVILKTDNGKTLLSVKNPYWTQPIFADGMPVSRRPGHGYGTRSIRYLTQRLGGNCQFLAQDNLFVVRVVV